MDAKESLSRFIDAVVSGDEAAQKTSFGEYTEAKTKELLGLPSTDAVDAPMTIEESMQLNEDIDMDGKGNMLGFDGNIVLINGKRVGRLEYGGEKDEFGESPQLYFVTLDGSSISITGNELADLVKVLTYKFLGGKK